MTVPALDASVSWVNDLTARGRLDEALNAATDLVRARTDSADAYNVLGNVLQRMGSCRAAENAYRKAIALEPAFFRPYGNLASLEALRGNFEVAAQLFGEALSRNPQSARFRTSLGNALRELGRFDEAIEAYQASWRIQRNRPARQNWGSLLARLGDAEGACSAFSDVLGLEPDAFDAHLGLALALDDRGLRDADAHFVRAAELVPMDDRAELVSRYLARRGREAALIALHARVCGIPQNPHADFPRERELSLQRTAREVETYRPRLLESVLLAASERAASPLPLLLLANRFQAVAAPSVADTIIEGARERFPASGSVSVGVLDGARDESLALSQLRRDAVDGNATEALLYQSRISWAESLPLASPPRRFRRSGRRLRVGYLSSRFNDERAASFFDPLFLAHDPNRVALTAYSAGHRVGRPRYGSDVVWRDVSALTDEELAAQIAGDGTQILVELDGHRAGSRLAVCRYRAAPIQMRYLGEPGTSGLEEIAYRITDATIDPPGDSDRWSAERLLRFPGSSTCFAITDAPAVCTRSSSQGPTFACLASADKLQPDAIAAFVRLLSEVPDARLLLKSAEDGSAPFAARLAALTAEAGIDLARITVLPWQPDRLDHLGTYASVDVALDPAPYSAKASLCEALWMGVPVVSLAGSRTSARVGASVLSALGLDRWVASDWNGYVRIAQGLISDTQALVRLRDELRPLLAHSPMTDTTRFVHGLENLYLDAWLASGNALQAPESGVIVARAAHRTMLALPDDPAARLSRETEIAASGNLVGFTWLAAAVDPGTTVIDVDAGYGLAAVAMGRLVGPTGRAYACDPDPDVRAYLSESAELSGVPWLWAVASPPAPHTIRRDQPLALLRATSQRGLVSAGSLLDGDTVCLFDPDSSDTGAEARATLVSRGFTLFALDKSGMTLSPVTLEAAAVGAVFGLKPVARQRLAARGLLAGLEGDRGSSDTQHSAKAFDQSRFEAAAQAQSSELVERRRAELDRDLAHADADAFRDIETLDSLLPSHVGDPVWRAAEWDRSVDRARKRFGWSKLRAYLRLAAAAAARRAWEHTLSIAARGLDTEGAHTLLLDLAVRAAFRPIDRVARLALAHRVDMLTTPYYAVAASQILRSANAYREAKDVASSAASRFPESEDVSFEAALLNIHFGDYEGAHTLLTTILHRRRLRADGNILLARLAFYLGENERARAALDTAVSCSPLATTLSDALLYRHYDPDISQPVLEAAHRLWGDRFAKPRSPSFRRIDRRRARALRIGYVSGDFRAHAVASFSLPLIEAHDASEFEVYLYSTRPRIDRVTERFRRAAKEFRDVGALPDELLARLIVEDNIDILVDLSGHTLGNALRMFAWQPAPVQATYLGYPDTTSVSAIDFRFTDARADPPESPSYSTEELVRLPRCAWAFHPFAESPPSGKIANADLVFGSFNNFAKVNRDVLALWATILRQVPGSRLLLKGAPLAWARAREAVFTTMERLGVARSRLTLKPFVDAQAGHLGEYGGVDIALDTFPYNGTTTTCEALWMGVPVVTLVGDRHCGRVGSSLLATVGLHDLVASTKEEYVAIAVDLAQNRDRLSDLREKLREQVRASPLGQAESLARSFERAYRELWVRWLDRT